MISVYKRHTPFSIVVDKVNIQGTTINIPKKGDLLSYVYFTRTNTRTQLVELWDPSIINSVSLYIGDRLIDKQDPTFVQSVAPQLMGRTYSKSSLTPVSVFYPLQFFFCNDLPLPLISIQKDDVKLVLDWTPSSDFFYECHLCYIYLGQDEREWFARTNMKLGIYQVNKISSNGEVIARNPVKFIATEPIKLPRDFQYGININGKPLREVYNSHGAQFTYHTEYGRTFPSSSDTFPTSAMSSESQVLFSNIVSGRYIISVSSNTSTGRGINAFDVNSTTQWNSGGQSVRTVPVQYVAKASSNVSNAWRAFDNNDTVWLSNPLTFSGFDRDLSGDYVSNASSNTVNAFFVFDYDDATNWISSNNYGNLVSIAGTYTASASSNLQGQLLETNAFDGILSTFWQSETANYYLDSIGRFIINVSSINGASSSLTNAFNNNPDNFFESNISNVYGLTAAAGTYTARSGTPGTDAFLAFDNPNADTKTITTPVYGANVFSAGTFQSRASSNNGSTVEFSAFNPDDNILSSNTANALYGSSIFTGFHSTTASTSASDSFRPFIDQKWSSSASYGNSLANGTYSIVANSNSAEAWRVSDSSAWFGGVQSNGCGMSSLSGTYSCRSSSNNNVETFRALDGLTTTSWESEDSTTRRYGTFFKVGETYSAAATTNTDNAFISFRNDSTSWASDGTQNVYTVVKKAEGLITATASTNPDDANKTFFPSDSITWASTDQSPSYGNAIPIGTYTLRTSSGGTFNSIFQHTNDPINHTQFNTSIEINQLTAEGNSSSEFTTIYSVGNVLANTSVGRITDAINPWNGSQLTIAPKSYASVDKPFNQINEANPTVNTSKSISFTSADYFGTGNVGTYFTRASSSDQVNFGFNVFDNSTVNSWISASGKYNTTTGLPATGAPTTTVDGVSVSGEWVEIQSNAAMIFDRVDAVGQPPIFRIVTSQNGSVWKQIFRKAENDVIGQTVIPGGISLFTNTYVRVIVEKSRFIPPITSSLDGGWKNDASSRCCDDIFWDITNKSTSTINVNQIEPFFKNDTQFRPANGSTCSLYILRGASYAASGLNTNIIRTGAPRNQNSSANWEFVQSWSGIFTTNARQILTINTPIQISGQQTVAFYLFAGTNTSQPGELGRGVANGQHNLFRRDDETLDRNVTGINANGQLVSFDLDGSPKESNVEFYTSNWTFDTIIDYSTARCPASRWGTGSASTYGTNRLSAVKLFYFQDSGFESQASFSMLSLFFQDNLTHPTSWPVRDGEKSLSLVTTPVGTGGGFFCGNLTTNRRTPITSTTVAPATTVLGPWIEFDFTSGFANTINVFSITYGPNSGRANNVVVFGYNGDPSVDTGAGYSFVSNFQTSSAVQNGNTFTYSNLTFTTRYRRWRFVFANTVINNSATAVNVTDMKLFENNGFGFLHPVPADGGVYIKNPGRQTGTTKGEYFAFNYSALWTATRISITVPNVDEFPVNWALFGSTTWDAQDGATWLELTCPDIPINLTRNTTFTSRITTNQGAYRSYRFVIKSTNTNPDGLSADGRGGATMTSIQLFNSSNIAQPPITSSFQTLFTDQITTRVFSGKTILTSSAGDNTKLNTDFNLTVPDYITVGVGNFSDRNLSTNDRVANRGVTGSFQMIGNLGIQIPGIYEFVFGTEGKSNIYINHSASWWTQQPNNITSGTFSINFGSAGTFPLMIIGETSTADLGATLTIQDVPGGTAVPVVGLKRNGGAYVGSALTGATAGLWYDITFPVPRTISRYNISFPFAAGLKSWSIFTLSGASFVSSDSQTIEDVLEPSGTFNNMFTISTVTTTRVRLVIRARQPNDATTRDALIRSLIFLDPDGRPVMPSMDTFIKTLTAVTPTGSYARGFYSTSRPSAFVLGGENFTDENFDPNTSNFTGTESLNIGGTNVKGVVIQITLPYALTVRRYSFILPSTPNEGRTPTSFRLAGSSTGIGSFTLLDQRTSLSITPGEPQTFVISSPAAFRFIALVIEKNNGGTGITISNLRLFGANGSILPNNPLNNFNMNSQNDDNNNRFTTLGGAYEGDIFTTVSGQTIRGEWIQHTFPLNRGIGVSNVIGYQIVSQSSLAGWVLAFSNDNGSTFTLIDRVSNNYSRVTQRDVNLSSQITNIQILRLIVTEAYNEGVTSGSSSLIIDSLGLKFRDGTFIQNVQNILTAPVSTNTFECITSGGLWSNSFPLFDATIRFNPCESIYTSNITYNQNPPRYIGPTPATGTNVGEFIEINLGELRQITKFSFKNRDRRYSGLYFQLYPRSDTSNSNKGNFFEPDVFSDIYKLRVTREGYTTDLTKINQSSLRPEGGVTAPIFNAWGYFYAQEQGPYTFTIGALDSTFRTYIWFGANALNPTFNNATASVTPNDQTSIFSFTQTLTKSTFTAIRIAGFTSNENYDTGSFPYTFTFRSPNDQHNYSTIEFNLDGWVMPTNNLSQYSGEAANNFVLLGSTDGLNFSVSLHTANRTTGYFSPSFLPRYDNVYTIATTDTTPVRKVRFVVSNVYSANVLSVSNLTLYDNWGRIVPYGNNVNSLVPVRTGVFRGETTLNSIKGEAIAITIPSAITVFEYSLRSDRFPAAWNVLGSSSTTPFSPSARFRTMHSVSNYYLTSDTVTEKRFTVTNSDSNVTFLIQITELQPSTDTNPTASFSKICFFDQTGVIVHTADLTASSVTLQSEETKGSGITGTYEIINNKFEVPSACFDFSASDYEFGSRDSYELSDTSALGRYRGPSITSNVIGFTYESVVGDWFQIKFPTAVYPRSFSFNLSSDIDAAPSHLVILGSNDFVTWRTLFSSTNLYFSDGPSSQNTYTVNNQENTGSWSTYRFVVSNILPSITSTTSNPKIGKINFDGSNFLRINSFLTQGTNIQDVGIPNIVGGRYTGTETFQSELGEWFRIISQTAIISNVLAIRPATLNLYPSNIIVYGSQTTTGPFDKITVPQFNLFGSETKYIRFTNSTAYKVYTIQITGTMENLTNKTASASTIALCNEKSVPMLPFYRSDGIDTVENYDPRPFTTAVIGSTYRYFPLEAAVGFNSSSGKHFSTLFRDFNIITGFPNPGITSNVLTIKFPNPVSVYMYTIKNPNLNSWSLYGSQDNLSFTSISTFTNQYVTSLVPSTNTYTCYTGSTTAYRFFRFNIDRAIIGQTVASIGGIDLYDRQGKINPQISLTSRNDRQILTTDDLTSSEITNGGNVMSTNDYIITFNIPSAETINSYSISTSTPAFLRSWQLQTGGGTVLHTVNDFMFETNGRTVNFFIPPNSSSRSSSFRLVINGFQNSNSTVPTLSNVAFYTEKGFRVMPINFTEQNNTLSNQPSTSSECLGQYVCDSTWGQNPFDTQTTSIANRYTIGDGLSSNGWSVYVWFVNDIKNLEESKNIIKTQRPDYTTSNIMIVDRIIKLPTGISGNNIILFESNVVVKTLGSDVNPWRFKFNGGGTEFNQWVWFTRVNNWIDESPDQTGLAQNIDCSATTFNTNNRNPIRWILSKRDINSPPSFSFIPSPVSTIEQFQIGPSLTQSGTNVFAGEWSEIQFPGAFQISGYTITGSNMTSWRLLGTNVFTRTSWTTIDNVTSGTNGNFPVTTSFPPFSIYRIIGESSGGTVDFGRIIFSSSFGRVSSILTQPIQTVNSPTLAGGTFGGSTLIQTNVGGTNINGEFLEYTLPAAATYTSYVVDGNLTDWVLAGFNGTNFTQIDLQTNQQTKLRFYRGSTGISTTRYRLIIQKTSGTGTSSTADVTKFKLLDAYGQRVSATLTQSSSTFYNAELNNPSQLMGEAFTTTTKSSGVSDTTRISDWVTLDGTFNSAGSNTSVTTTTVGARSIRGDFVQVVYEKSVIPVAYRINSTGAESANGWCILGSTNKGVTFTDIIDEVTNAEQITTANNIINASRTAFDAFRLVPTFTRGNTGKCSITDFALFDISGNIINNIQTTQTGGSLTALNPYTTTVVSPNQTITGEWIQCNYDQLVSANCAVITYNQTQSATNVYVVARTDGVSNWNFVGNFSNTPAAYIQSSQQVVPFFTNLRPYLQFRFIFISMNGVSGVNVKNIDITNIGGKSLIPSGINTNDFTNPNPQQLVSSRDNNVTFPNSLQPGTSTLSALYQAFTGVYTGTSRTTFFDVGAVNRFDLLGEFFTFKFTKPTNIIRFAFKPTLPAANTWAIVGSNDGFFTGNCVFRVDNLFTPATITSFKTVIRNTTNAYPYLEYRIIVNRVCTTSTALTGVTWDNPVFVSSCGVTFAPGITNTDGTLFSNITGIFSSSTATTVSSPSALTLNGDFVEIELPAQTVGNVYSFTTNIVPISWYLFGSQTTGAGGSFELLHTSQNNYYSTLTNSVFTFSSVFTNITHAGYRKYRLVFTEMYSDKMNIRNLTISTNTGARLYPFMDQNIRTFNIQDATIPTTLVGQYTFQVSSISPGETLTQLFDMKPSTVWTCANGSYDDNGGYKGQQVQSYTVNGNAGNALGEWVEITFPQPAQIGRLGFINSKIPSMSPNVFILLGSLDGVSYTNIICANTVGGAYPSSYPSKNQSNTFLSLNTFAFSKVKFVVSNVINNDQVSLADFGLYSINGRIIPRLDLTSDTDFATRDTSFDTDIVPLFGGRYTGTRISQTFNAAGAAQSTTFGEWIQIAFPVPITSLSSPANNVRFLRLTGTNLPSNASVLVSNQFSGTGLTFRAPLAATAESSSAVWVQISNNYTNSSVLTIPLPNVPTLAAANASNPVPVADIMRIVVQETGPISERISTFRCNLIELLDNKQRSIITILSGAETGPARDVVSQEIIGGSFTPTLRTRFGGIHRGTDPVTVTNTIRGEWIQIQFPEVVTANNYSVMWGNPEPIGWSLFGSTNGSSWQLLDDRARLAISNVTHYVYQFKYTPQARYSFFRLAVTEMDQSLQPSSANVIEFRILNTVNDVLNRNFTGPTRTQTLTGLDGVVFSGGRYRGTETLDQLSNVGEWVTLSVPTKGTKINSVTLTVPDNSQIDVNEWSVFASNDGSSWRRIAGPISNTTQIGTFTANVISEAFTANTDVNDVLSPCGPEDVVLSANTNASGTYNGPDTGVSLVGGGTAVGAWAQLEYFAPFPLTSISFTTGDSQSKGQPIGRINRFTVVGSNDYATWTTIVPQTSSTIEFSTNQNVPFSSTFTFRYFRLVIVGVETPRDFIAIRNLNASSSSTVPFSRSIGESTVIIRPITSKTVELSPIFDSLFIGVQFNRVTNLREGTAKLSNVGLQTTIRSQRGAIPPQPMTSNNNTFNVFGDKTIGQGFEFLEVSTNSHPIRPSRYILRTLTTNRTWGLPISWIVQASNDGVNFDTIDVRNFGVDDSIPTEFTLSGIISSYTIFKIVFFAISMNFVSNGRVGVSEFRVIDFSNIVSVPNVLSLAMTSNITTGTVPVNQANTYNVATGNHLSTFNTTAGVSGEWVQISIPTRIQPRQLSWSTNQTMDYHLYGSNDGRLWSNLVEGTMSGTSTTSITSSNKFSFFRVVIKSIRPTFGQAAITELSIQDVFGERRNLLIPFCLKTNSLYHSGSLNFSMLDSFKISNDLGTDKVYAVSHNILSLENGSADLVFR